MHRIVIHVLHIKFVKFSICLHLTVRRFSVKKKKSIKTKHEMHHLTFHSFILSILCPPPPISYFTPFLIFLSLLNPHSVTFTSLCLLSLRCFCPPIENSNCPLASDWFYWPAPQPVSWRLTRSPLVALNASDNKETGFLPCENEPAHTQGHTHTHTHTKPTSSAKQNLSPSHKCWVSSSLKLAVDALQWVCVYNGE